MAQRDWNEVLEIFSNKDPHYLENFLKSDSLFAPNESHVNPFNAHKKNFRAQDLEKSNPGSWIPIYKNQDVPKFFHDNNIMPIRSGSAEFFFYKGEMFFNVSDQNFEAIDTSKIDPIESFMPSTLTAKFQRNENAFLNKAVALGYINHFLEDGNLHVLTRTISNKSGKRFLYGQFGKIKTTKELPFETSQGKKMIHEGFQFEIDLVLENEDEIIIFEAKSANKPTKSFSLLQLYYPLIYFKSIIHESKKMRTVFIDITSDDISEEYRFLELTFENDFFDQVHVSKQAIYCNQHF